jgi:hypothetical protein
MNLQTYEGNWEDLLRHAAELAGKRVRITVLEVAGSPSRLDQALADLIAEAEQRARAVPGGHADVTSAKSWGEFVIEKYRRQGFDL